MWRALGWSLMGLGAALRHEPAFRLEMYLFSMLAPLAVWVGQDGVERVLLLGSLLLVLIVEMINSAIEAVVDRASPDRHVLAGRAKDMGSAAVLLALVNVVVCWLLILGPRLF